MIPVAKVVRDREFRCTAPHPDQPGRLCNAIITCVVPGTVTAELARDVAAGCSVIACRRCGTYYRICPAKQAA